MKLKASRNQLQLALWKGGTVFIAKCRIDFTKAWNWEKYDHTLLQN